MREIKTLLADDHAIVMEGIKEVLSADEEITVIGTVANGEEALRFIRKNQQTDVVVLDINMPIMDGISCSRILKRDFPNVKIILLTMYAQKSFTEEIIKIGIDGCLLKNNSGKELIEAILRVMGGKQYYDRIGNFNNPAEEVTQYKLSDRELEIIKMMADGLTSSEIAAKLYLSNHTVKTHRKNILRKLNVNNSSQAVQYCLNNQLI